MPIASWLAQTGKDTAENAIQGGLGLILGGINDRRQVRQQERLQALQIKGQKEMSDYNFAKQLQMWHDTGVGAQVKQYKDAGMNPGLMYGMGGGGGQTAGSGGGSVQGASAPGGGREAVDIMGLGLQRELLQAQKEVMLTQAEKNKAEAAKTAGVDTKNVTADTENKILQSVLLQYGGKEAKDMYEKVTSPNRGIQAKTYEDELKARQGTAGTIYEMWVEGKLKDKSLAEVEKIMLENAKTREETRKIYSDIELLEKHIKGAELNNMITELEAKLQTQTGIDRNSPTWYKILGRLFVTLMGK